MQARPRPRPPRRPNGRRILLGMSKMAAKEETISGADSLFLGVLDGLLPFRNYHHHHHHHQQQAVRVAISGCMQAAASEATRTLKSR